MGTHGGIEASEHRCARPGRSCKFVAETPGHIGLNKRSRRRRRGRKRADGAAKGRQMQAIPGHWRTPENAPWPGKMAPDQVRRTRLRRGSIPPAPQTNYHLTRAFTEVEARAADSPSDSDAADQGNCVEVDGGIPGVPTAQQKSRARIRRSGVAIQGPGGRGRQERGREHDRSPGTR